MLPFSVDKMIMEMRHNIEDIKHNIIKYKYSFCCEFEKELGIGASEYSQTIFDYLFNLFYFKQAFGDNFKKYVQEFKDVNFKSAVATCNYISSKYQEFIVIYKQHFFDYFGFKHEDPLYITRKIHDNRKNVREKLMEYYQ